MPAFRARPVVAALVVSLASAACGGGEGTAENGNDDSLPEWFDVPPAAVQMGDRFEWCADLADRWAEQDARWAAAQDAKQEMQAALDAVALAMDTGDDLDVAEATQARNTAMDRYGVASGAYFDVLEEAEYEVLNAYRLATGQRHTDDETFDVAAGRAWEAFLEHSPETKAAAAEGGTSDSDEHHPLRDEIHQAIRHNAIGYDDASAYDAFRESFSESCA